MSTIAGDSAPPACKVVYASTVAEGILREVKFAVEKLGRAPLLVGFLANADPAARMYASWTEKTCLQKFVNSVIYLFIFIFYPRRC